MIRARVMLSVVLALALALVGSGLQARADDPPLGSVAIATVTPSRIDAGDEDGGLALTGSFTNTTGLPLTWATAELWVADSPLVSFEHVDAVLATDSDAAVGSRLEPGAILTEETPIQPGQTVEFRVEAPLDQLGATTEEIATLVGVHVRAVADDDGGGRLTVGRARALVPHAGHAFELLAADLVTVAPGADIAAELEALAGRLASTAGTEAVTIIDPLIHRRVAVLADAGDETAAQVVADIARLRTEGRLWRTAQGNPNLGRMPEALRAMVPQWADDLVAAEFADLPLVAVVGDPSDAPEGFDEVLVTVPEGGGRLYRLADDAQATLLDGDGAAPPPPSIGRPLDTTSWGTLDARVQLLVDRTPLRLELTTPPDGEPPADSDLRPVVLESYSADFTDQEQALAHFDAAPITGFDASQITLSAVQSFVMGARTNQFPATINNQTPLSIHVRIATRSENPQRIHVPNTDVVTVSPGESLTMLLEPVASVNGVTTVHAQLESAGGQRVGSPATIEITATEFGRVGWIIIIVSGAVVLGGTVWRIRAVRREQAAEASEAGR